MNTQPLVHTQPLLDNQPEQPGKPARRPRHRILLRAALTAAALAGAGGLLLATPGIASASVDQTSPQWAELGPNASTSDQANQVTAVYTIQNVAEPGTEMLEDNNNSMASDTTIDVWTHLFQGNYQDPMATGSDPEITQGNYLWEFVPDNASNGSIVNGAGELINRQSGLCLDDNGSPNEYGDGATITQYSCTGAANQQWTAVKIGSTSTYEVEPTLDNGGGDLGIGNGSSCSTHGDGDSVYIRTTGLAGNPCDQWYIQRASYDFATNPVNVSGYVTNDGSSYACLTGDALRQAANGWDFDNLSDTGVTPDVESPSGGVKYLGSPPETHTGQIMFYCDPPTTTP